MRPHPSHRPGRPPAPGAVRATASAKKSSGEPLHRAGELGAHAGLVAPHPAPIASRHADTPDWCRAKSGSSPGDFAGPVRSGRTTAPRRARFGIGAPERLSYHQQPVRSRRSTQSVQPPAASGIRGGGSVGGGVGVGQVADPATADRRRCARPGCTSNTSAGSTGRTSTLGAITAAAPNQSPISAAGGGSPRRPAASATARSTAAAVPTVAEPLDAHRPSLTPSPSRRKVAQFAPKSCDSASARARWRSRL